MNSVWVEIEELFEIEGFDYAMRFKGMPMTGNKQFDAMVDRYKKLANKIESYVQRRAEQEREATNEE